MADAKREVDIQINLTANQANASVAAQVAKDFEAWRKGITIPVTYVPGNVPGAPGGGGGVPHQPAPRAPQEADPWKRGLGGLNALGDRSGANAWEAGLANMAKQQVTAIKAAQEEYAKFTAKGQAANRQLVEGSKQSLEGITALARGFVLLGVSSEKDLEKAVKTLAKFEAVANVLKGTINTVQGLAKAYDAYRTSVQAAAAAESARSAAQAAGGAAGAVGGGAAAGGAVGGGLVTLAAPIALLAAAIAAVAASMMLWKEKIDGTAGKQGSFTDTVGEWVNWLSNKLVAADLRASGLGSYAEGITGDGSAKTSRLEGEQAKRDQIAIDQARLNREADEREAFEQSTAGRVRRAQRETAAQLASMGLQGGARDRAHTESMITTNRTDLLNASTAAQRVAALEEAIGLQNRLEAAQKAEIQEKLAAARESLGLHKQELSTLQAKAQALEAERKGALGALSGMDPLQAQQLKAVAARAQAGEQISLRDAQLLQQTGLSQFNPAIEGAQQRQIEALGLADLLRPLTDALAANQAAERTVKAKIELDEQLTVKLEQDATKIATAVENAIRKFMQARDKAIEEAAREAVRKDDDLARAKQASEGRSRNK